MNRVGGSQNTIPGIGEGASEKCAVASFDWTVARASGDVFTGPSIQAGSVITGVKVVSSGLGSATFSVGDAANAARFVAAGATAAVVTSIARAFTQTTNGPVNITTATAATSATGAFDLFVYFLPPNA
jgi:hypothetical protein